MFSAVTFHLSSEKISRRWVGLIITIFCLEIFSISKTVEDNDRSFCTKTSFPLFFGKVAVLHFLLCPKTQTYCVKRHKVIESIETESAQINCNQCHWITLKLFHSIALLLRQRRKRSSFLVNFSSKSQIS